MQFCCNVELFLVFIILFVACQPGWISQALVQCKSQLFVFVRVSRKNNSWSFCFVFERHTDNDSVAPCAHVLAVNLISRHQIPNLPNSTDAFGAVPRHGTPMNSNLSPMGREGGGGHTYFLEGRLRLSNPQIVGVAQHLLLCPFRRRSRTPRCRKSSNLLFFSLPLSFCFTAPPRLPLSASPCVRLAPSTSLQETETRQRPKKIRLLTDKR